MMLSIGLGILLLIVPILIIVFIIAAFVKGKNEKDNESFEKKIRVIYMYMVVIVALIMMVGGTIALFNNFMDLLLPDRYSSGFNRNMVDLFTNISILIVSIPLFIYHSKKVRG